MSLLWRDRRKQLFARASGQGELRRDWSARKEGRDWSARKEGRDWSARKKPGPRRIAWAPIFVALVLSLLSLTALRISIIRFGYALGATLQRETELRTRERSAAVAVRIERDPHKLRELAARQGFARPERVINLAEDAR